MTARLAPLQWQQDIGRFADASGLVELTALGPADEDTLAPVHRCRVLYHDGQQLVVARPPETRTARAFRPGGHLRLVLVSRQQRWTAVVTVHDTIQFRLDEQTMVPALALSCPRAVKAAQRRTFYRVAVAGLELDPMQFVHLDDADLAAPARDARPLLGRIVNIGAGGIGALVERARALQLAHLDIYRLRIALPDAVETLQANGQLLHIRPRRWRHAYAGFRFVSCSDADRRRLHDRICRLLTSSPARP